MDSPFAISVTRQPSSIKAQLAAWGILLTLGASVGGFNRCKEV